jgi:hypothetical protein
VWFGRRRQLAPAPGRLTGIDPVELGRRRLFPGRHEFIVRACGWGGARQPGLVIGGPAITTTGTLILRAIVWLYYWIYGGIGMIDTPQKKALNNYRKRLRQRGVGRFEILGRDADRELIRSLAKRLVNNDPDSLRIRAAVQRVISGEAPKKGGILDALLRSPLAGASLDLNRPVTAGRRLDL